MQPWTEKHRPADTRGIAGQGSALKEILGWLEGKRPKEALFLYGPPGTGKTLAVEAVASERGYVLLQMNASDKRGREEIDLFFRQSSKTLPLFGKGKIILIDEIDGMPSSDRGAVASILGLIRDSSFPVILIANDPWKPKLKPLRNACRMVRFSRVPSPSVAKRLREICSREGIRTSEDILKNLARWSQGDLRSAISDLQIISSGKGEISEKDLEALGHRERDTPIYNIISAIMRSKNISAARKLIQNSGRDPDEIFLWVETNLAEQFSDPEALKRAYDIISRADTFRALVMKQQNWRFRLYMSDLLSGISLSGDEDRRFISYKPPERLALLGRTKTQRALLNEACRKIGEKLHCSVKIVKAEYLPYLRIILRKNKDMARQLGLEANEINFLIKRDYPKT